MTTQLSTLKNGLRVASMHMPQMESVAVSIGVDVGARYETTANNGVSHMLEHMAFKGTKRRSALQIAEQFDAIGGNLNAYTSMEHTVYYARVLREDVSLAMDILADILQHSLFAEEELERERQVILQEIAMHHDVPEDCIFDVLTLAAYPDQPVGRSILGPADTVSNFTREDLITYVDQHYHASRMVLTGVGNITHEALMAYAEEHFSGLPMGKKAKPVQATYVGGEHRMPKDLEQAHLMMALPSVSYHHPDYRAQQILANILGGGMSSRLFQEVREKRGLAYSISAFTSCQADHGLFGVYVGTGEKEAGEVTQIIAEETHKLAHTMTEDELSRAKTQMIAGVRMAQESVSSQSETLTRHVLCYGRAKPMAETIAEVQALSVEQLQENCKRIMQGLPTIAALGPVDKVPEYAALKSAFAA